MPELTFLQFNLKVGYMAEATSGEKGISNALATSLKRFLTRLPETRGQNPVAPIAPLLRKDTPTPLQDIAASNTVQSKKPEEKKV